MTPREIGALQNARRLLAEIVEGYLRDACLIDKATGEPIRETLDDLTRTGVEDLEEAIRQIDAVL